MYVCQTHSQRIESNRGLDRYCAGIGFRWRTRALWLGECQWVGWALEGLWLAVWALGLLFRFDLTGCAAWIRYERLTARVSTLAMLLTATMRSHDSSSCLVVSLYLYTYTAAHRQIPRYLKYNSRSQVKQSHAHNLVSGQITHKIQHRIAKSTNMENPETDATHEVDRPNNQESRPRNAE